ncbi:MAG: thioredoxin domain-containing protein [Bacteroidota bacterium]
MANRLADALSPYLQQHADNPVDWYPWGPEAFAAARALDRPIFLSIGYATCHWCHVMAHESFEDAEVARLMNKAFVNVKVDREERPDVDALYMGVCQLVTGQGGWPLTVILTPEQEPFYVATYLPRQGRYGRPGMLELTPAIDEAWRERRSEVRASAAELTEATRRAATAFVPTETVDPAWMDGAVEDLADRYDAQHGGFGQAPKFPTPHHLIFLLRQAHRTGQDAVQAMVTHTLRCMRAGGVFDHVGYGFHRYATDATWTLPHFEKMLYDQALHVLAYTEAYQATRDPFFRTVAEEVIAYVQRDLGAPEGAFYAAEDADSDGREGAFYVWTVDELRTLLPADLASLAIDVYNAVPEGNFEDEATRRRTGENVLFLRRARPEIAAAHGLTEEALQNRLAEIRHHLLAARAARNRPLLDDKILTDWNGLMIAALAQAGAAFGVPRYVEAAAQAAAFCLATLRTDAGRLLHRYRAGQAGLDGLLDDYAFLIWGLLNLYEATYAPTYLRTARDLAETVQAHFIDEEGGFFLTPDDGEPLLTRPKEAYDGALPSGNSVMVLNLIRLSRFLGAPALEDTALNVLRYFGQALDRHPAGFTAMLTGLDFGQGPSFEVVLAGDPARADLDALRTALREVYQPRMVTLLRPPGASPLLDLAPYVAAQAPAPGGTAQAYVCQAFSCQAPVQTPEALQAALSTTPTA